MTIVVDDKIPFIKGQAERLGNVVYRPGARISAADVRHADALIVRTRTHCGRELLEGSKVRFVATATIGFDHIDTGYLAEAGIGWANCPGCNAASVAQYVQNSLLLLEQSGHLILSETTVGIVGVGHVGSKVAKAAKALGCRTLLCDPPRQERGDGGLVPLSAIEAEADVITLHVPLTHEGPHATFHMADAAFFSRLQRWPVLINSSRGEVADTGALKTALADGRIRTAVIDTWENEPDIDRELLRQVFLGTPHIAGYSADGKANGTRMALEAVARHFGADVQFEVAPPRFPEGYAYYPEAFSINHPHAPYLRLYDPRRDSEALKQAPEQFEQLRENYPLRREFFS